MKQDFFAEWIASGVVSIPHYLLQHYHEIQLTDSEVVFVIHLLSENRMDRIKIDIHEMAVKMNKTNDDIFQLLSGLLEKECLFVFPVINEANKQEERYSLQPMMERLQQQFLLQGEKQEETTSRQVVEMIEREFGRPLSSFELQMIQGWLQEDHYALEMITAALKEAVINQALTLNYMDRILLTWDKKGIKTLQQLSMSQKRYRQRPTVQQEDSPDSLTTIPIINLFEKP